MTRRTLAALTIATAVAGVGLVNAAYTRGTQQKPVRQSSFHVDGVEAPATVDALWGMATTVIAGSVVEVRDASQTVFPLGGADPATLPQTMYVVDVQRVFKSDGPVVPGARIEIQRVGGAIDRGKFIEDHVDENFAKFKAQKSYVFFLKRRDVKTPYYPVAGPDSAFELNANRVMPFGKGGASRQLEIVSPDDLFALLEKRGGRK